MDFMTMCEMDRYQQNTQNGYRQSSSTNNSTNSKSTIRSHQHQQPSQLLGSSHRSNMSHVTSSHSANNNSANNSGSTSTQQRSTPQNVIDELQNCFSNASGNDLLANISRVINHLQEEDNKKSQQCQQLQQQQQQQQQQTASSRYKTELCRPFEEHGHCKYGDKCQFAHGSNDMRSLNRHPKYKTEPCRTFHNTGICPYGPRCHFIHSSGKMNHGMPATQPKLYSRPKGLSLSSIGSNPSSEMSSLNSDSGSIESQSPSGSPTFGCVIDDDDFFLSSALRSRHSNNISSSVFPGMSYPVSGQPITRSTCSPTITHSLVDPIDELAHSLSNVRMQRSSFDGQEDRNLHSTMQFASPIDLSGGLHLPGVFSDQYESFM